MFDFLKELWKPVASNLKAQILVFAVLVLILGLVFALALPTYQAWILGVTGVVVLAAMVVYVIEVLRATRFEKHQPAPTPAPVVKPVAEEAPRPAPVPAPTPAPPVVVSLDSLREAYLDSLIADCQRARLVGLDPKSADPRRTAFPLDKLYVALDTKTRVAVEKKKGQAEKDAPGEETRPLSALAALEGAGQGQMVLLGLPGSGKTTFVRFLALRLAQAVRRSAPTAAEDLPGWGGAALLPVIVPLGRLAEALPRAGAAGRAEDVERFILQTLPAGENEAARQYAGHIMNDLARRPGLFLFDGLDEVADLALRPRVVQAVEAFAARIRKAQPGHRFLVTCRTFSYTDPAWQLSGWPVHELAPFTPENIEAFVDAWHDTSIQVDPARREDYEEKRGRLKEALRQGDPRRLWEIADNPLVLTLMAVVHTTRGELPDARALVYEECIRQLLIQWEAERSVQGRPQRTDLRTALNVPEITLNNALQEVAYHAHERQPGKADRSQAALVTEDLLWGDLCTAFDSEEKVRIFLSYCESANGLLLLQGVAPLPGAALGSPPRRVYAFPHLTFQEYLAARYLGRMANPGEQARSHLDRSDRWREVVMLLGEHICFREGNHEVMDSLLTALAPEPFPARPDEKDWRALWMAGDLLVLYRRAFPRRGERHANIPAGLVQLLHRGALTVRERAAAGDTLARLGDPRFDERAWFLPCSNALASGPDHPDVLGFVPIPAGPFLMGSRRGEPDSYDDEYEQHELALPEYYLARTPVTVAQFGAFVAAAHPELDGQPNLDDPANHPVVNVSWNDALQYCRWLTARLREMAAQNGVERAGLSVTEKLFWQRVGQENWQVRLPSEAEWEKAARGPLAPAPYPPAYPWGAEFDPEKANIYETRIGTTSALGCFPAGRSSYGLLDMSGNVWEWTRSIKQEYPYNPVDGREDLRKSDMRVLRGGSFVVARRVARCAFRHGSRPNVWHVDFGFRVGVVSPIISDL